MSETRIVAVSDLHGLTPDIPKCDILLIPGDISPVIGSHSPTRQLNYMETVFFPWCQKLIKSGRVSEVAFTPGNHDFVFQRHPLIETPEHVHMLIDKEVELLGLRVYWSPWSPRFGNWAFMLESDGLTEKFSRIPEGIDILITHGPAYGACDEILEPQWTAYDGDPHLGSPELAERVKAVKPKWHLCGHIHTGQHQPQNVFADAASANVSLLDEGYAVRYQPLEFSVFRGLDG